MQSFLFSQKNWIAAWMLSRAWPNYMKIFNYKGNQKITTVAYNMLSIRDPPESKGHAQIKSKGTEED